jgi:hypothetical protein
MGLYYIKMDALINELGINEEFQKNFRMPKKPYSSFKSNVPQIEDYNMMVDVLFLPKDKKGYAFLLVCLDLASQEFDIEPMKSTTDIKAKKESVTAETALNALKTMFKRKHIKMPYASISADGGGEFKGVFKDFCYRNSILLTTSERGRHKQQGPVEYLNKQLGRLFNGYMNKMEIETGKPYKEWTDVVDIVRTRLNEIRKKKLTAKSMKDVTFDIPDLPDREPKFKEGDLVYRKLDHVEDALGNKQPSEKYREGDYRADRQPRMIEQIFIYAGNQPYRYQLKGLKHVSYAEWELRPAKEEDELFEVRKFLDSRKVRNKQELLTWYWGELRKEASWQPRSEMMKFVPEMVKEFEESKRNKK